MWQRFNAQARKVVFAAQEEAQNYGHGYVSTEHILLGLLRDEDCVACKVLAGLDVSTDALRAETKAHLVTKEIPAADMTLTPRAKRVIDLAFIEARTLNHDYIGTEHLLLGLVREGDGLAGRVLSKLGVTLTDVRHEVAALVGCAPPPDDGNSHEGIWHRVSRILKRENGGDD